ncbi:fungal hydrophobin [Trichoderma aggressivum f. europaeum]|uniref:Fungal hydrophobin n=1 Tax=Trichoderma aggressivum f. europaeum TaxID=173218 RepID=A0AAE1I8B7_9HYPO|nr:fungal hydrophobin [Trichoderma aggressivum f. europaeum]
MQFLAVAALLFTSALAAPSADANGVYRRANAFCPDGLLYTNPQCCDADVLGLADLDCVTPPSAPTSCKSFDGICASIGREPKCCAVPIIGVALLCVDPVPQ